MSRNAREIDLDSRSYVGLSFPLRADSNNNFQMTKNSLEQSRHNLKNLLLTHVGERVGQPEFGSNLRALCFEPNDNNLPEKIEEDVRMSVEKWLPYIDIQTVDTLTDEAEQNKVFVKITYTTTLNPETLNSITLDSSYTATTY